MIALTGWLKDAMDLWPIWAALGSTLGAWLLWSIKSWARDTIANPIAHMAEKLSEVEHLVRYHLGPNDCTKPVHRRLIALEKAHNIEQDYVPDGADGDEGGQ